MMPIPGNLGSIFARDDSKNQQVGDSIRKFGLFLECLVQRCLCLLRSPQM